MRSLAVATLLLATAVFAACAGPRMNLPLDRPVSNAGGYRLTSDDNSSAGDPDRTFVVLAASGGGARAAAFTYGVLKAMRQASLGDRTLLGELDLVSSVSGGSFPAAYYGLFPDTFFSDFPKQVLDRPLGRELALRVAAPWNLLRLLSPSFSRSDLAAEFYDDVIFSRRTFADMPRRRPFIMLNGTDLASGATFPFTQNQFDVLCSNLDSVPVARAVAASSAVPVGFTPLTFRNYPKSACGYTMPAWATSSPDFETAPRRWALAKAWRRYEDAGERPYVHVGDGALSDNTGLRGFLDLFETGDPLGLEAKLDSGRTRRLVVILVDALENVETDYDQHARPPSATTVLESAVIGPLESYSAEMAERLHTWFARWERDADDLEASRARCDAPGPRSSPCRRDLGVTGSRPRRELYVISVRLDSIPDGRVRKELGDLKTVVKLTSRQVDLLVDWAGKLMLASPDYQRLLRDLASPGLPS